MTAASTSTKDRIATVEPIVRRVLAPKVLDSHHLDDLVQETLARVGSSRRDLEGEALVAYAIVAARNVWASDGAREARRGALQHRLADTRQPEQPDLLAVAGERQDALRTALVSLSEAERRCCWPTRSRASPPPPSPTRTDRRLVPSPPGWPGPGPSSGWTSWSSTAG